MITYSRKENIHLSDEQLYDLIKQNFRDGYYESAINLMETNPQLDEKLLGQIAYNSMQNNLKHLQEQNDPDFKKDLIPLSYDEPRDLPINKIWFKITKEEKAVVEKTYAELLTLKQNNQLEVGNIYLLKDYVTKYQQPVSLTMKVGKYDLATATPSQIQEETEPLLLQAISKNEFAVECYSFKYPEDIIYYDFNDNICEDGSTPRNGFILRRYWVKNEVNVPNDWRHIKWARFKVDTTSIPTWTSGAVEKGKYYIVGNDIVKSTGTGTPTSVTDNNYFSCTAIEDYANNYILADSSAFSLKALLNEKQEFYTFQNTDLIGDVFIGGIANNTVFKTYNTSTNKVANITISNSYGNTFIGSQQWIYLKSSFRNIIGDGGLKIQSGGDFFNNIIGKNSHALKFGAMNYDNVIGKSCSALEFGEVCAGNMFGSDCDTIKFANGCKSNIFSQKCSNNTFGSACINNTFGIECSSNTFGSNCSRNNFTNYLSNNLFGNSCSQNELGRFVTSVIFGTNVNSCVLPTGCHSNFLSNGVSNVVFSENSNQNYIGTGVFNCTFSRMYNAFVKTLENKNLLAVSLPLTHSITIEKMSNGQYCYWYKAGTSPSDVITVQIP